MSPLKGAILPSYELHIQLVQTLVLLLLVTNVLADHLFVQAYGRHE